MPRANTSRVHGKARLGWKFTTPKTELLDGEFYEIALNGSLTMILGEDFTLDGIPTHDGKGEELNPKQRISRVTAQIRSLFKDKHDVSFNTFYDEKTGEGGFSYSLWPLEKNVSKRDEDGNVVEDDDTENDD